MSDIFRKTFAPLSDDQKIQMEETKGLAQIMWDLMDQNTTKANGLMMAIAKTNLEQSIMWAVKAITEVGE